MFKNTFIRNFVAGLMLVIFSFSITPTIFLHNWLANHKDSVNKLPTNNHQQVGKEIFNCNCDNIVAESPFTYQDNYFELPALQVFILYQESKPISFSSSEHFFFSLRGPPSMS